MCNFNSYRQAYKNVRFERRDGILEMAIHRDGGPAVWDFAPGGIHDQLGRAFRDVGQDRENRVIIFTGTGDVFLEEMDMGAEGAPRDMPPAYWDIIYHEGKELIQNLLNIEVPVIGAVNGRAYIHAELITMSDIVLAADHAAFADKVHFELGSVPGDGTHVWWPLVLGPNRGRSFLLTGEEIQATEALRLGLVKEVLPADKLLARAWEIAATLAARPLLTLRYTRVALTQQLKKRMLEELGYGLMLEGMAINDMLRGT